MDDAIATQLAQDLADAISAAAATDAKVAACHTRARESGFVLKVVLATEVRPLDRASEEAADGLSVETKPAGALTPEGMSAADRRFLKALRIAPSDRTT